MKIKLIFAYLSLLVAASLSAPLCHAGDGQSWYALAGIGEANTNIRPTIIEKIDDNETVFEIGLGYKVSDSFALEGSYIDYGSPTGVSSCPPEVFCVTQFVSEPVDVDGWSFAVRGSTPVNESLSVFARVGLLAWDASANSPFLSDSGTDLLYGAGIAARLNERTALQLSFDKAEADISAIKLGINFGF